MWASAKVSVARANGALETIPIVGTLGMVSYARNQFETDFSRVASVTFEDVIDLQADDRVFMTLEVRLQNDSDTWNLGSAVISNGAIYVERY